LIDIAEAFCVPIYSLFSLITLFFIPSLTGIIVILFKAYIEICLYDIGASPEYSRISKAIREV